MTPTPTLREHAEQLIGIGIGLSSAHLVGNKIADHGRAIIHILDAAHREEPWGDGLVVIPDTPRDDANARNQEATHE